MASSTFSLDSKGLSVPSRKKGVLILSMGLGGTGQTTHLKEVARTFPDCVLLEKDILNEAYLGEHKMQSKYYNDHVKMQTYVAMINLARSLISLGKTVIIDGGVGGKLLSFFRKYLSSPDFDTKVLYFHCSGVMQYERIVHRNADRDVDKLDAKFGPYRQEHVTQQLRDLKQLSDFLFIDTEDASQLLKNVERIVKYIQEPSCKLDVLATDVPFPKLSIEDAKKGSKEIKVVFDVVKYFQVIVKQEAVALINSKSKEFIEAFNKLSNDNEKSHFIWEKIKGNVAARLFKEFKGFYSRNDDPNFLEFVNLGLNILLENLNSYLQLPWYGSKATRMHDFGSRLHSGNVRLWSVGGRSLSLSLEGIEEVRANNILRP